MNDQFLDDLLKAKMDNHASDVPADMFDRIMNARKKKRRPIIWWWFGAAMVLGLSTGGYFLAKQQKENKTTEVASTNAQTVEQTNANSPKQNIQPTKENNSSTSPVTKNENPKVESTNADAITSSTTVVNNAQTENNELVTNDARQANKAQTNTKQDKPTNIKWPANNKSSKNWTVKNKRKTATKFETKKCKKEIDDFDNPSTDVSPIEFASSKANKKNKRTTASNGENDIDGNESEMRDDATQMNASLAAQKELQSIDPINFAEKANYKVSPINFDKPEIPCPTNEGPGDSHWFFEAYAAPDVVTRNITSNPSANNYASKRDSTENGMLSFSAGFRIGKQFGDHFSFKTGLNYSQINETFKLSSVTERRTVTVITVRTITLSNGTTVQVSDTSFLDQFGTRSINSNNSYSSLDLPLIVGYGFDLGTWRVNLNVGAMLNMKAWNSGDIRSLDTLNGGIISLKNSGYYKSSFGVGWFGSISFLKPIGERWSFMIEPYMHLQPNNMVKDGLPFTHSYQTTGVNIGLRYRLSGGQRF
jgi:hypothetical protein